MNNCKNCDAFTVGNFCNYCGQSVYTKRITVKTILHEVQHGIFHVDKGVLYTAKELILRPGETIRNYLEGKRVRYFKPFAFAFLLSTIYTVLDTFSGEGAISVTTQVENLDMAYLIYIFKWINQHLAYGSILMLPLISAGTYLAFLKSKYNYPEHLILNAYILGLMMFMMGFIELVFYVFRASSPLNKTLAFALISFLAYLSFFKNIGFIKRFFLSFLAIILIGLIFIAVIIIIVSVQ